MKKLVVLLAIVGTVSLFGQGQVNFNTKVSSSGIDAPISYGAGLSTIPAGTRVNIASDILSGTLHFGGINARAALYGSTNAGASDPANFAILTPSVPFRSGSAAGYINPTYTTGANATRTIAGIPGGSTAFFQIRAWDTGAAGTDQQSYEDAVSIVKGQNAGYLGVSGVVGPITLSTAPSTPAPLVGLAGFTIDFVPEPSVIGLGILGALAGLVVFRRRQ